MALAILANAPNNVARVVDNDGEATIIIISCDIRG
jgi:hypothetical protein